MLAIEKLQKNFGARTVLDSISYRFPDGEKIALVGPNGAGKTTLLNILTGQEPADAGQVLTSQGLKIGYLPQEPNADPKDTLLEECLTGHHVIFALKHAMESELHRLETDSSPARVAAYERAESQFRQAGGYSLEARGSSILHGLGFRPELLSRDPRSLSGGWRMRLELAKVFINDPDVLVLDEPTNHLDLPALMWVERYLQTFRGTLLFVSHDRALLNRLASMTLMLQQGQLRAYKGNFDQLLSQRELEEQQNEARRDNLARQREQLESFVERFGAKASKASQAQSKAKQIERLRALEGEIETSVNQQVMHLKLPEAPPSGRDVLSVKGISIGYDRPLATGINLLMERGSRIAIIGSNGIGKSTFLKTIAGQIPSLEGRFEWGHNVRFAYCAQNHDEILAYDKTILENLLNARAELGEREARQILGSFLFSAENVYKKVKVLSGGEKARVGLCRAMIEPSNLLLLDEPTNHLDMSSVEVLIQGLEVYSGSILFVSHDRNFIEALATHIFVMLPDGRSALFHGKLEDYQRMAATQHFPNVLDPTVDLQRSASPPISGASTRESEVSYSEEDVRQLKRERSRLQKQMEKLEQEQSQLRTLAAHVEEQLGNLDPGHYQKAQELQKELDQGRSRLDKLEEQWLEAAERLEAAEGQLSEWGRLN
jgi:ATP-binding cassette subfamily F protein 3